MVIQYHMVIVIVSPSSQLPLLVISCVIIMVLLSFHIHILIDILVMTYWRTMLAIYQGLGRWSTQNRADQAGLEGALMCAEVVIIPTDGI